MSLFSRISITPNLTSSHYDKKINLLGQFQLCPGTTCISSISMCCHQQKPILKSIEQFFNISAILQKHYHPVPYSSYHVTLFGMRDYHMENRDLIQTDINKLRSVANHHFPLKLKIVNMFIGKTLGLDVEFECHELKHFYRKWNREKISISYYSCVQTHRSTNTISKQGVLQRNSPTSRINLWEKILY